MRFKDTFKYIFNKVSKGCLIYYGILGIFIVLFVVLAMFDIEGEISGMDICSAFVISIIIMSVYKTGRKMLAQNGISRKTHFLAELSVIGIVSVGAAIIENVIVLIINCCFKDIDCRTLYMQNLESIGAKEYGISLLFDLGMFLLFISLWSFLAKLSNKIGVGAVLGIIFVIAFSVAVIFPFLMTAFPKFEDIVINVMEKILNLLGITNNKPYRLGIASAIAITILNTVSYLLMRRNAVRTDR